MGTRVLYTEALVKANNAVEINKIQAIEQIIFSLFYALNDNNSHAVPTVGYIMVDGRLDQFVLCMPDTELFWFDYIQEKPIFVVIREICQWFWEESLKWDREVMEECEQALLKK